jgi:hypothetical protein
MQTISKWSLTSSRIYSVPTGRRWRRWSSSYTGMQIFQNVYEPLQEFLPSRQGEGGGDGRLPAQVQYADISNWSPTSSRTSSIQTGRRWRRWSSFYTGVQTVSRQSLQVSKRFLLSQPGEDGGNDPLLAQNTYTDNKVLNFKELLLPQRSHSHC